LRAERLSHENCIWREAFGTGLSRTGSNEYFNVRSAFRGFSGQVETASSARHLHVSEEQGYVASVLFQYAQSLINILCFERTKAGIRQDVAGIHADDPVVIDDERERSIEIISHPEVMTGGRLCSSPRQRDQAHAMRAVITE